MSTVRVPIVPGTNIQSVLSQVALISAISGQILSAIPATAPEGVLIGPLALLVATAIAAYEKASGTPVTVESVSLLYPSLTPLVAPKA